MTFKDFYKKEKHIIVHGQSRRFRVIKYIILFGIALGLYVWKGLGITVLLFLFLGIVGIAVHFFFRWKTEGWTKSWGPYKRIPLNDD